MTRKKKKLIELKTKDIIKKLFPKEVIKKAKEDANMKGGKNMSKRHCNQCGKNWDSRVPKPKCCPYCKRYDWDKPKVIKKRKKKGRNKGGVKSVGI